MCGTIVLQCDCEHDFQNKHYGEGWRIHNISSLYDDEATCTSCNLLKVGSELKWTKQYLTEYSVPQEIEDVSS